MENASRFSDPAPSSDDAKAVAVFPYDRISLLIRRFFVLIVVCFAIPAARAQSGISDVHIEPRVQPGTVANLTSRFANTIRTRVDLVLVPVTVTDPMNRVVVGLEQGNFQLYEGKQSQEIKHFSREDAPVSLGVILDVSGSMSTKIERAREAVKALLEASNPLDEFFLITFSDIPHVVQNFTQTIGNMQEQLVFARPKGSTALLDALYFGLNKMQEPKDSRKAILLISNTDANPSRSTHKHSKSH